MKRWGVPVCFIAGLLILSAGLVGIWSGLRHDSAACAWPDAQAVVSLESGAVAAMASAPFAYSPGWQVTSAGADPSEPADALQEPAGVVTFSYSGDDLYLLLAPGDYWAYLFVTVDGKPANQLPVIAGNNAVSGLPAGYKPLLAPERAADAASIPVLVHKSAGGADHTAQVELWRGWGQIPLRGVAVDPAAAACGRGAIWPAGLLALAGATCIGLGAWGLRGRLRMFFGPPAVRLVYGGAQPLPTGDGQPSKTNLLLLAGQRIQSPAVITASVGLVLVIAGVAFSTWWLCLPGLGLLALAGVLRPAIWLSALLFGLPFAFGLKLPLLPTRAFDLIDIGVWGGVVVLAAHLLLTALLRERRPVVESQQRADLPAPLPWPLLALGAIVAWAVVAVLAAAYPALALREWRVVFLNALLFGIVLAVTLRLGDKSQRDLSLLVTAWLAGGAAVSLFGLWGYWIGNDLISQAEGVRRIQAFYASGNNLALYLDRTLAVTLALALFTIGGRSRLWWALLALPQALAWLLTFSKGSLLLAAPAMALVLLIGGGWLLRREGRSLRPLWLLLGVSGLALLVIAPFLGAERFQRLFDFGQGTGFLRLQLWRSAWQMALDHPLLGVGPDNFLYAYRSGYLLPSAWQEPNLNHPHNLLLDWWTRLGLPGLLLGLLWLGSGVAAVLRWLCNGPQSALALGVLAACAAAIAHGLIDVSYALPDLMIVWVFLFGIGSQATLFGDHYWTR